jgi:hypothetical protein
MKVADVIALRKAFTPYAATVACHRGSDTQHLPERHVRRPGVRIRRCERPEGLDFYFNTTWRVTDIRGAMLIVFAFTISFATSFAILRRHFIHLNQPVSALAPRGTRPKRSAS